jgi:uncharacterized membrane protein YfcA
MLLIWRGWGIVVVGLFILAALIGGGIGEAASADGRWVAPFFGLFLILAGIVTWYLGKRLNRDTTRELVDPKTGQTVVVRRDHSFFFIKVEWWGPIMIVAGAFLLVAGILDPQTTIK